MQKTITVRRNGHIVEYIPIVKPCTYNHRNSEGICKNCNNTMKYIIGYNMIIDGKWGFIVDNIK